MSACPEASFAVECMRRAHRANGFWRGGFWDEVDDKGVSHELFQCSAPFPAHSLWEPELRRCVALLPHCGLVIGAAWSFAALCGFLPFAAAGGAILTPRPGCFSGYIHLDGFLDSCDAILYRVT